MCVLIDNESPPGSWADHAKFKAACSRASSWERLQPEMQGWAERIVELERENKRLEALRGHWEEIARNQMAHTDELEDKLHRLEYYAQHDGGCALWHSADPCDCGLRELL